MNFVQDINVFEEVFLDDDDIFIVSIKNDKMKVIFLEIVIIVLEFEGFLVLSNEVWFINGGKGQQYIYVVRMLNEIVIILFLSIFGMKGYESVFYYLELRIF